MTPLNQHRDARPLLLGTVMVLLVFAAYFPALRGQILWDDGDNVFHNQTLRTLGGLRQIWFKPGATQQYYPLTYTTFWLEYHLWGLNTTGYHALNILLHAGNSLLLWGILRRVGVAGAWWGAAIFALHPVCVESVAWITERKNVLCGVFFLGSILSSIRFWLPGQAASPAMKKKRAEVNSAPGHGGWIFYGLALCFYLCALWAKTAAMGLPAVIVLLLWWKRFKFRRRDVFLVLPFLVVGVLMGLITIWVEKNGVGATGEEWHFSWVARCLIAGRALWFYIGKLLWPHPLEFMYPRWVIEPAQPLAWLPLVAAAAGVVLLWRKRNGPARPVLFTTGYFIAMLFPVLGFFNVFFFSFSFVSDHFQYLACMAPLALAGAGLDAALGRVGKGNNFLKPAVCGVLLLGLGILTRRQTGVYRDIETLWRETLAHNEGAWMAHNSLGDVLVEKGKTEEAIQQYEAALRLKPDFTPAHNNLGNELMDQGNVLAAISQFTLAVQLEPQFAEAHYNLAVALDTEGDVDGAMGQYQEVLRLEPGNVAAHNNLGDILRRKGKLDEAIQQYTLALQIGPEHALIRDNLGYALAAKGNLDESILQYIRALQLDPNLAAAHGHLGLAYAAKENLDEAVRHFQIALQIQPGFPDGHYNLGVILVRQGKLAQARTQFIEALRLKPDDAEAAKQLRALPP